MKKKSCHGETAFKQKHENEPNNQPNNQTDEDKNKKHNVILMSQGTNRKKMRKINTQAFTFFIFSTKFVVVVVKELLMPMLTLHCHCSNDATVQSLLIFLFVNVIVVPTLMLMFMSLLCQNFQSCCKLFFFSSSLSLLCIASISALLHFKLLIN